LIAVEGSLPVSGSGTTGAGVSAVKECVSVAVPEELETVAELV
jgi:hypothetical protein